jgi:hypothetical protein
MHYMNEAIPRQRPPSHAPWHSLRWGLFLPLVFMVNVAVASFAWFIVWLAMR